MAGGIGRALACKLKDEGWQVIGASRHGDDLAVAEKVVEAVNAGHQGVLDL